MNFKLNKGITLIALIITIIVMLILVAVTIRVAIKGDLFNYAKTASIDTKEAISAEQLSGITTGWKIERNVDTDATIAAFLAEKQANGEIDFYTNLGDGLYKIGKGEYETTIQGEREITFYIYHSSDNTIETITQRDDRTFNIYSHTKPGLYYGGYYSDYYGKGSYAGDGVEAIDGTEIAYDGIDSQWNYEDAFFENGMQMHPQDGVTYYLKEVPTYCLQQHVVYTFNHGDRILRTLYIFSAIDDCGYEDVGVVVDDRNNKVQYWAVRKELTVNHASGPVTYTTQSCFGVQNGGYIMMMILTDYLTENRIMKVTPYWVTKDNILVLGTEDVRIYDLKDLTIDSYSYTVVSSFD